MTRVHSTPAAAQASASATPSHSGRASHMMARSFMPDAGGAKQREGGVRQLGKAGASRRPGLAQGRAGGQQAARHSMTSQQHDVTAARHSMHHSSRTDADPSVHPLRAPAASFTPSRTLEERLHGSGAGRRRAVGAGGWRQQGRQHSRRPDGGVKQGRIHHPLQPLKNCRFVT